MNGNDIRRVLNVEVIKMFTDLMRPRIMGRVKLAVQPGGRVKLDISSFKEYGSNARADRWRDLLNLFGECSSLFSRPQPLCVHEIERFKESVSRVACMFASMFPGEEPTPKMHGMLYHMLPQMRRCGGTGIFHEGVVEALHVLDNRMRSRFACVRNLEEQLACRAKAIWQLCDPGGAPNVRAPDHDREARKRLRMNTDARAKRARYLGVGA